MNIASIKKTLTRLYRLFFVLACVAITLAMFTSYFLPDIDADQYPVSGAINTIVTLLFIAAVCRVVRDLLPTPKTSNQTQG